MAKPKFRLQETYEDFTQEQIADMINRVGQGAGAKPITADMVNHPPHYTQGGIETIDIMEAKSTPEEFSGHLRLTAIKYLSRAGLKESTLIDLKKAQWYVNELVAFVEKQSVNSK
jgi:hypothetical protein